MKRAKVKTVHIPPFSKELQKFLARYPETATEVAMRERAKVVAKRISELREFFDWLVLQDEYGDLRKRYLGEWGKEVKDGEMRENL